MKLIGEQQKRFHQAFILLLLLGLVASAALLVQIQLKRFRAEPVTLGMTYSTKYAYELGLDSHQAYIAMIDDLGAKHLRLPIYWTDVEKTPGVYDWGEVKWMAEEAAKRGVDVTFAIGERVPRYPECFIPEWLKGKSQQEIKPMLLAYLDAGVKELNGIASVKRWQVENEPYFGYFGECPQVDSSVFAAEVATVRAATTKPIMTTSSGEFGSWSIEGKQVDTLGISMYRGAYLAKLGYFAYPIPAWYYPLRKLIASDNVKDVVISELQVEPWLSKSIVDASVAEQIANMPLEKIRDNIEFARETGFNEIWLWGPEWWYYLMQKQGNATYWEAGKQLFK